MAAFYFVQKRKRQQSFPLLQPIDKRFSKLSKSFLMVTLEELMNDTNIEQIPYNDLNIVSKIGVGASGVVSHAIWHCNDKLTDATIDLDVAIKELHSTSTLTDIELKDFVAEIALASKLQHPNIVRFLGVSKCDSSSSIYLISEYMKYGSLQQALDMQYDEIKATHRIKILCDCALGMAYLHQRCIIHRDLKVCFFFLVHIHIRIVPYVHSTMFIVPCS